MPTRHDIQLQQLFKKHYSYNITIFDFKWFFFGKEERLARRRDWQ